MQVKIKMIHELFTKQKIEFKFVFFKSPELEIQSFEIQSFQSFMNLPGYSKSPPINFVNSNEVLSRDDEIIWLPAYSCSCTCADVTKFRT